MFNWLKGEIDRVRLNENGWRLTRKTSTVKAWENDSADILSLNFFDKPPDIPVSLSQITELRNFYRKMIVGIGGGIIKVESTELKGLPAVECIFKVPMQPQGMSYLGSFTIPFREKSYVVKLQCLEHGITGARDASVFMLVADLDDEAAVSEDFDPFKGWMKDPYDNTVTKGVLMNLSEAAKYDAKFPTHPLSRVRKHLSEIRDTISFNKQLIELARFG